MTDGAFPILIDLMRHGQPVGGRRYRGQIDDPLSNDGWMQMRAAVAGLQGWDAIVTSPLLRCAEFARELGARLGLPVSEDRRLMEIGFGAWEGLSPGDLDCVSPGALQRFRRDPAGNRPQGAEVLTDFQQRVHDAWRDLATGHAHRHVLVVTHAGVIRMVMSIVLGLPCERMFHISVSNASMTRVRIERDSDGDFPVLVFHGGRP